MSMYYLGGIGYSKPSVLFIFANFPWGFQELVFKIFASISPLVLMSFPQIFAGDGGAGAGFVIGL